MNLTTVGLSVLLIWITLGVGFNIGSVSNALARTTAAATTFCLIAPVALFTKKGGSLKRSTGRTFAKFTKGLADTLEATLIGMIKAVGWICERGFEATRELANKRKIRTKGV